MLTTPQHNNNMTKENTKHYIAYYDFETYVSNDLLEIFEQIIKNSKGDKKTNKQAYTLYIWYLPNPAEYAGFCSSGIPKFGPLDQDNKLIGIPIYLGTDPHNARIVQKHMMSSQNNYKAVQKELAKY